MIKMVNFLTRTDGMTHDEFVDYWYTEHSEIAKELPGLRKYATAVPVDPERADYDGIVELYFDDMGALADAFDSEAGKETMADAETFADVERGPTMYVEETVQYEA
ncbi:EthD family reductase [Haloferacaceae archaeon DSL9]